MQTDPLCSCTQNLSYYVYISFALLSAEPIYLGAFSPGFEPLMHQESSAFKFFAQRFSFSFRLDLISWTFLSNLCLVFSMEFVDFQLYL